MRLGFLWVTVASRLLKCYCSQLSEVAFKRRALHAFFSIPIFTRVGFVTVKSSPTLFREIGGIEGWRNVFVRKTHRLPDNCD